MVLMIFMNLNLLSLEYKEYFINLMIIKNILHLLVLFYTVKIIMWIRYFMKMEKKIY